MTEITVPNHDDLLLDRLTLYAPAQVNRSEWTRRRKVIGQPGRESWRGQATIDTLTTEDQERPWRAWLFGLDGPVNWFRWPLPCNRHIGGKPTVAAGAGDGYELDLEGMTPNALILRAGQFMTVPLPSGHARAVCLLEDLRSDGSGEATAVFRPALTEAPAEDAVVETADPYIPMCLTESEQGFALADGVSGASFDVEEA